MNVFDSSLDDMPCSVIYRSWVFPDLYPVQPQPVLSNWHPEDLAPYCGGCYAKAEYADSLG